MVHTCPHCGTTVLETTKQCPSCGKSIAAKKDEVTAHPVTMAQRMAGLILLINGIFLLAEMAFFPSDADPQSHSGPIISIILGGLLFIGRPKVLIWAKISVILGAVIFTAQHVVAGDAFMAGFQLVFSLGLILLLFGQPGNIRIGVSVLSILVYFLFEMVGIQHELTGKNLLTPFFIKATYNLDPLESRELIGHNVAYRIDVDHHKWLRMKREDAIKENPLVDTWLVHPDYDAHLFTITEVVGPNEYILLDKMVDAVIENGRNGSDAFTVAQRSPLESHPETGEFLDATVVMGPDKFRFHYGVFSIGRVGVQVVCYTYTESFQYVKGDCEQAIASFALDEQALQELKD